MHDDDDKDEDDYPPGRNFVLVGKMLNALIGT